MTNRNGLSSRESEEIVTALRWLMARVRPDPYGIEAALAERKRLRLNGWVRRQR